MFPTEILVIMSVCPRPNLGDPFKIMVVTTVKRNGVHNYTDRQQQTVQQSFHYTTKKQNKKRRENTKALLKL